MLAAECPEQIRDRGALRAKRLDARDARGEEPPLGVDDVELARDTVLVAQLREAQRLRERLLARRLGLEALARACLAGERGAHFAERVLDRFLVLRERRALAGAGGIGARLQTAAGEDRLRNAGGDEPQAGRTGEETGERGALAAGGAGKDDRREHLRTSSLDARVGRGE